MAIESITVGGGCFWCIEAAYQDLKGVISAISGYAGGKTVNPGYREVCTGSMGHAEVVQISFDNDVVDVRTLLAIFFTLHDPTTLNRQGADVGSQYRSVIFYHNDAQRKIAQDLIAQMEQENIWPDPVVTEVLPLPAFYPQACLRPRDRFWDIPVPKIDSAFDNLLVPQPSWSPSTTQQLRKLVAAPYLAPNDWTPRSEAYFVFPLAQGTPGKQCGLAATGVYQPSLRSPWLAAAEDYHQNYYRQNPGQGYCQAVISPKLTKFRDRHRALLKS